MLIRWFFPRQRRVRMMQPEHAASRLLVLSDLHLAPPGEHCVFAAHEPLVALIQHLADVPADPVPQWLLLNGDVFDFLQIPGYGALSLPLAPRRMTDVLDALDAEPPHRNVVRALARFTAAGHRLSCLPGNHDAELNLASVQQVLAERLGSSSAIAPHAGQWQLSVAGRLVMGLHGHHEDAFNAISSERMRDAQAAGDATVPMPPGSRLVCQVINPFRRAKTPDGKRRFPFIDRLPSDQAVVLAIMLLDPRLAGKRLKDALGIGAAALVRKALMMSGTARPKLSVGVPPALAAAGGLSWIDELVRHVADTAASEPAGATGVAPVVEHELDAYFAGQGADVPRRSDALAGGEGAVRGLLWRALARVLASTRDGFRAHTADRLAQRMISSAQAGTVTITGHTHAAKAVIAADGTTYLNTGTWLDQVLPPADPDASNLPDWLARLQRDELPTWNGHPLALVDDQGARLMRWDGNSLVEWSDATD